MPWASSTRRQRLPSTWPALRLAVLVRDGYACQLGLPGHCLAVATDVDHITPNDDHSMANLQAVCLPCHKVKTQDEAMAGRSRRARPREPLPGIR